MLEALAFATAALAAVHMFTLVWLTAFVYHGSIRGYVPAGLGAMCILGVAALALLVYLAALGRIRGGKSASFVFGGMLGVPIAVFVSSLYASMVFALLRYSWQKDVAISAVGGVLFVVMAVVFHKLWLCKKADNNGIQPTK
jgi:hypothetical protein